MTKSFEALLRDSIDYAGMFPPAKLPFPEAFAKYLSDRNHADVWLLSRFILPIKMFAPFCDTLSNNPQERHPVRVVTIGGEVSGEITSSDEFALEMSWLPMLGDSHPDDLRIESYEARLAMPVASEIVHFHRVHPVTTSPSAFGEQVASVMLAHPNPIRVFLEFPFDGATLAYSSVNHCVRELEAIQSILIQSNSESQIGMKIRCGGKQPPTASNIAAVIQLIANSPSGVLFKATQGLHHPFHDAARPEPHGFVNLFAAAVLAFTQHIDSENRIEQILLDDDPKNFHFDWEGMRWGEYKASVQQIENARKIFQSFGSCSFDEPLDDLHRLGLV